MRGRHPEKEADPGGNGPLAASNPSTELWKVCLGVSVLPGNPGPWPQLSPYVKQPHT